MKNIEKIGYFACRHKKLLKKYRDFPKKLKNIYAELINLINFIADKRENYTKIWR